MTNSITLSFFIAIIIIAIGIIRAQYLDYHVEPDVNFPNTGNCKHRFAPVSKY